MANKKVEKKESKVKVGKEPKITKAQKEVVKKKVEVEPIVKKSFISEKRQALIDKYYKK